MEAETSRLARRNQCRMKQKKRVLLVWWYTRQDLTEPLVKTFCDYEIAVLYYPKKEEEKNFENPHHFLCFYWMDYATPEAILKATDPDLIVFMGLDSTKTVALRMAAAKRSIPCFVLEHGVKNDIGWIYKSFQSSNSNSAFFIKRFFTKGFDIVKTLRFAISIVGFGNLRSGWSLLRFMLSMMLWPPEIALAKNRFSERLADHYFVFAPFQESIYKIRGGVPQERLHSVGSIFFDDFFQEYHLASTKPRLINEPYALLIDQPLFQIGLDQRFQLFSQLSEKVKASGRKLVIKLHPEDYNDAEVKDYMDTLPDVIWVKQADVANLVYYCDMSFGFYSTLLIPIICFKPCYIFDFF